MNVRKCVRKQVALLTAMPSFSSASKYFLPLWLRCCYLWAEARSLARLTRSLPAAYTPPVKEKKSRPGGKDSCSRPVSFPWCCCRDLASAAAAAVATVQDTQTRIIQAFYLSYISSSFFLSLSPLLLQPVFFLFSLFFSFWPLGALL